MMKHYCYAEKRTLEFEGQCNWCGMEEIESDLKDKNLYNENVQIIQEKMEIIQEYEIPDIPGLTLSPEELISQKQDELLKIYNEIQELKKRLHN